MKPASTRMTRGCKCPCCTRYREERRLWTKLRGASGFCIFCKRKSRPDRVLCEVHAAKQRAKQAGAYQKRKEFGLCGDCGRDFHDFGVTCPACKERKKLWARRYRAKLKANRTRNVA